MDGRIRRVSGELIEIEVDPYVDIQTEIDSESSEDECLANLRRNSTLESDANVDENKITYVEVPMVNSYPYCTLCSTAIVAASEGQAQTICDNCLKKTKRKPEKTKGKRHHEKRTKKKENDFIGNKKQPSKNKNFTKSTTVKKHLRVRSNIKEYVCEVCSKTFNFRKAFERHLLIHSEEKNFQCNLCSKSFGQLAYLRKHQNIHSVEKVYFCQVCDKGFNDSSYLTKHKLIHTGSKPYSCKICLKAFNQLGTLKRHQLVHTNEKNFECEVCLKKFARSDKLKRHLTIHTAKSGSYDPVTAENTVKTDTK